MSSWQTSRRQIPLDRTLVMAILNVTPDSFSDGGRYLSADAALRRAERMIDEGADIIDIGGESTRPGSSRVSSDDESGRVVPVIEAISKRFDIPISIDTWKAETARRAAGAGAEIINDISGLRWEPDLADVAARGGLGIVLMHSRGEFETMHSQEPVTDIFAEVTNGLRSSLETAQRAGIRPENAVLDVGIGFGKTPEQNLGLIGQLDKLAAELAPYPVAVGISRKSFIAKVLGGSGPEDRLAGSLAAAAIAVWNGARILRVHDIKETVETIKTVQGVRNAAMP